MNKKQTRKICLGILALAVLTALRLFQIRQDRLTREEVTAQERQAKESSVVFALPEDQIAKLEFTGRDNRITFVQEDGVWKCPDDPVFVMRKDAIQRLTGDLAELTSTRVLDKVSPDDLASFGLEPAAGEVLVTDVEGKTSRLYWGIRNHTTKELYLGKGDQPDRVYLTKASLDLDFTGSLTDFFSFEDVPSLIPSQIRRIEIKKAGGGFVLDTPGDDSCTVTDPEGKEEPAGLSKVGTVQSKLGNLSWLRHLAYGCEDFSAYGLDPPAASLSITMESGEEVLFLIGKEDANGNYLVRLSGSDQVHSVRREALEDLVQGRASSFWSLSFSFVSMGDLEELYVTYQGKEYRLKRVAAPEDKEGEAVTWLVNEEEREEDLFKGFYYECVSVTAEERLETVPDLSQEEALLILDYRLKEGGPKTIRYYEADQNACIVLYDKDSKAAKVNRVYVLNMIRKLEALLEG